MEPSTIFFIVCMIVLIYLVYYSYFFSAGNLLSSVVVGNTKTTIKPPVSEIGSMPATATYSVWINVNDWAYNKIFYKNILTHQDLKKSSVYVSLAPDSNDINVQVNSGTYTQGIITNVPLQTWVHLAVVINQKTFDLYLNGKLIQTKLMNNSFTPTPAPNNQIILGGDAITPDIDRDGSSSGSGNDLCFYSGSSTATTGTSCHYTDETTNPGFSGWITRFNYFQDAKDPQTIWNMYLEGSGVNNFLSNLFGNYGLTVSLTSDGVVSNTISI